MAARQAHIDVQTWLLLVVLSVLWGGSFLFNGIAVRDLTPLVIVTARVVIAAAALLPVHFLLLGALPRARGVWLSIGVLALFNNVLPFTLIVNGQTMIASGLASVINATAPLFGAAFLAAAGEEQLGPRKLLGLIAGIAGVMVLKSSSGLMIAGQGLGIAMVLGAAACYGLSSLWIKRRLKGVPPLTLATGQLLCSSAIMVAFALTASPHLALRDASLESWLAVLGLALLATSLAYIVFFKIIERSGAANVLLVTMLIPVSAVLMGFLVLGERLEVREFIGAAIIIFALLIIDGRVLQFLRPSHNPA